MTARKTMTNNNDHTPRVMVTFDQELEPPPLKASNTMDTANSSRCDSVPYDDRHRQRPDDGGASSPASPCGIIGEYDDIERRYRVDPRVLGTGNHGSVREGTDIATGERRAVKSIRKCDGRAGTGSIAREIALLREVDHRGIVGLVDVFEDDMYVHIVTDLCGGGELFDRIIQKTQRGCDGGDDGPCFSEGEAARVVYQILDAVSYLHDRDIVHRDIKPENILFDTPDEDSPVKLIDFGLSRKHAAGGVEPPMSSFVGTPYYIAPEVLNKKYDRSCDLWSVGIVAYTLLSGYPPFNGADNDRVLDAVRGGRYSFPAVDWGRTSRESRDFVRRLLQKDPRRRMTAREAMAHPWILRHRGAGEVDRWRGGVAAAPTGTATAGVAPSAEAAPRGASTCRANPPPAQPSSSPSPTAKPPGWTMRVSSGRFRYTPPFSANRKTPIQDMSTPRHPLRSSFW
jgi:serine/threonine protein kinase